MVVLELSWKASYVREPDAFLSLVWFLERVDYAPANGGIGLKPLLEMRSVSEENTRMTEANENTGLLKLTEEDLRGRYEKSCERVQFSSNDYYKEILRRSQEEHASEIRRLTKRGTYLAVITTILAVVTAITGFVEVMQPAQETSQIHESRFENEHGIDAR